MGRGTRGGQRRAGPSDARPSRAWRGSPSDRGSWAAADAAAEHRAAGRGVGLRLGASVARCLGAHGGAPVAPCRDHTMKLLPGEVHRRGLLGVAAVGRRALALAVVAAQALAGTAYAEEVTGENPKARRTTRRQKAPTPAASTSAPSARASCSSGTSSPPAPRRRAPSSTSPTGSRIRAPEWRLRDGSLRANDSWRLRDVLVARLSCYRTPLR
jgi:hypothetical protein